MAGLTKFINSRHQEPDTNNINVSPPKQLITQRQNLAANFKVQVPGRSINQPLKLAVGLGHQNAVHGLTKTNSPGTGQQGHAPYITQPQHQVYGDGQNQQYYQNGTGVGWPDSTLGTESEATAMELEIEQTNNGPDDEYEAHEQENTDYLHSSEDNGQDQYLDGEQEEVVNVVVDQRNAQYQRGRNGHEGLLTATNANIPLRSMGRTTRFEGANQQQQRGMQGNDAMHQDEESENDDYDEDYKEESQTKHPFGRQQAAPRTPEPIKDRFAASEIDEDTIHSGLDKAHYEGGNGHPVDAKAMNKSSRKRSISAELDYDEEKLYGMTYDELRNQPFDNDPRSPAVDAAQRAMGQTYPLEERLKSHLNDSRADQEKFLQSLSVDEWEQAGEWFITRFSETMTKFAELRRQRRNIAADFEKKLSERDALIKGKSESLNSVMHEMKKGGINLLRGKTPTRD
jgi:hypothetical protein